MLIVQFSYTMQQSQPLQKIQKDGTTCSNKIKRPQDFQQLIKPIQVAQEKLDDLMHKLQVKSSDYNMKKFQQKQVKKLTNFFIVFQIRQQSIKRKKQKYKTLKLRGKNSNKNSLKNNKLKLNLIRKSMVGFINIAALNEAISKLMKAQYSLSFNLYLIFSLSFFFFVIFLTNCLQGLLQNLTIQTLFQPFNRRFIFYAKIITKKEDIAKTNMFKKNILSKQMKGVSKQIRKKFGDVLNQLELDLRLHNKNKQQNLEKLELQVKKISRKINKFSNLLLQDDFVFQTLDEHPLIMIRYCEIMMDILTQNLINGTQNKKMQETQKAYNQSNVYQVVASLKLQNFDLKQKLNNLDKQLELAKQRAICSQNISLNIRQNTENFLKNYEQNFALVCDLLKKAQNNQIQLLQNNRYLKQQLQSLSIQFERYKQYFKQGPSLKQKQFKIKNQLERQYEMKLKNMIKQVQIGIKNQLQRSVVEKFNLKDIKNLRF